MSIDHTTLENPLDYTQEPLTEVYRARSENTFSDDVDRQFFKRSFDLIASILLIVFLLPFLVVFIVALLATSGSPVLYSHSRIGRGGVRFDCLKFRTMVQDSDRCLQQHLKLHPAAKVEWEATRKLRNDPRVLPLGRLMRVSSLDELPQLINIIKGDMSIVGPRPVMADELDQYYDASAQDHYTSVRPGLTGLWQVSGRNDTSYAQRVALDVEYVRQRTFLLDLKIIWKTVGVLLWRTGAY